MATNVSFNGNVYPIPAVGEDNWGQGLTDYFIAIANGALQKSGGNFTLTADVNFGATYGLLARYFSSRSGASTAGLLRLANLDVVAWRNFANNGNLSLGVNASDQLVFNGSAVTFGGITSLTGDVTATGPGAAAATISNGVITNAKVSASAAIDFSKFAALPSAQILVGSGLNVATAVAMSGDVTISNLGVTAIGANKVTNAMLAQVATATFKGRTTAGTGNVEDLSVTQATALLNVMVGDSGSGGTKGLVPAPAAGDAAAGKFLKADGTFAVPGAASSYTQFSIADNQSSPANVTSFLVSSGTNNAFVADMSILRHHDAISDGDVTNPYNAALGAAAFNARVRSTAIQPDGKTIHVGHFTSFQGITVGRIVRLNKDGSLDQTFKTNNGTGANTNLSSVALQSTGKIIIGAPNAGNFDGNSVGTAYRINADGTYDSTFTSNLGSFTSQVDDVSVHSDDTVYICGRVALGFVKTSSSGVQDSSFATNLGAGFSVAAIQHPYRSVIQTNGKIVVVGGFTSAYGATRNRIVRVNTDGTEDAAFYTALGAGGVDNLINAVALDSSGNIFIGGSYTSIGGVSRAMPSKISSAGSVDATFNTNVGTGVVDVQDICIQSDDKVVVGGSFPDFNGNSTNNIVRLSNAGVEDSAFTTAVGTGFDVSSFVYSVARDADDSIYAGGTFVSLDGDPILSLALIGTPEASYNQALEFWGSYDTVSALWELSDPVGAFDDTGVALSITSGGQLQYTSTDLPGAVITSIGRYMIRGL